MYHVKEVLEIGLKKLLKRKNHRIGRWYLEQMSFWFVFDSFYSVDKCIVYELFQLK